MNSNNKHQPCGCKSNQQSFITNYFNPNSQVSNSLVGCHQVPTCNNCIDIFFGKCTLYTGANLLNLGVNTNDSMDTVLIKLDEIKRLQDLKNLKLLANINDLNTRLNILAGGTPNPPYTLL